MAIRPFTSPCDRHRDRLIDFADRHDPHDVTAEALDHLDRCPACREEIEATFLAIVALRRLQAEAGRAEPPADAWPRLRARVVRRAQVWRWRTSLAGLAVGAGLAATILAPRALWQPVGGYLQEAGTQPTIFSELRMAEDRAESMVFDHWRATRIPAPAAPAAPEPAAPPDATRWSGPDGLPVHVDLDESKPPATRVA